VPEPVEVPPGAPLAALGGVLLLDGLLSLLPARPLAGVLDEAAHLATGTIVLATWPAPTGEFAAGLAAGSVLIDVDHVPELWGRAAWLRPQGVRPLPHSLATPGLAAWRAARSRSEFWRGAAVGLGAHLARDLATGTTGVALLWPLSRRPFSIRYRTYVGALALLCAAAGGRAERGSSPAATGRAGQPASFTTGPGSAPRHRASHPGSPPPPAPTPAPDPRPGSDAQ
jgi:hypothetical protein